MKILTIFNGLVASVNQPFVTNHTAQWHETTDGPVPEEPAAKVDSTPKPISQQPDALPRYLRQMWKGGYYDQI
jgi:hypothetical protein